MSSYMLAENGPRSRPQSSIAACTCYSLASVIGRSGLALTAVAARATIGIGTSGSSKLAMDER